MAEPWAPANAELSLGAGMMPLVPFEMRRTRPWGAAGTATAAEIWLLPARNWPAVSACWGASLNVWGGELAGRSYRPR